MIFTYYSSTDCVIRINDRVASDIFALQFGEQEQVLPVYAWNDRFYHSIGSGNILVSGTIIYNAKFPNYVELLASGLSLTSTDNLGATLIADLKQKITDTINDPASNNPAILYKLAKLNETWNSDTVSNIPSAQDTYELRKQLFSIAVEGPNAVDTIANCRVTGKATEVNAGEAKNIMYAQTFIGQKVNQSVASSGSGVQSANI